MAKRLIRMGVQTEGVKFTAAPRSINQLEGILKGALLRE